MNVIISNQKKELLDNLNIDIIKSVNGQFEVEEIIEMFKNFYYQRMILDITAIKNYFDIIIIRKKSAHGFLPFCKIRLTKNEKCSIIIKL